MAEFVEVDRETGRAFVIQRKRRPPKLLQDLGDAEALAGSNPLGVTTAVTLCREEVQTDA